MRATLLQNKNIQKRKQKQKAFTLKGIFPNLKSKSIMRGELVILNVCIDNAQNTFWDHFRSCVEFLMKPKLFSRFSLFFRLPG